MKFLISLILFVCMFSSCAEQDKAEKVDDKEQSGPKGNPLFYL